jgi:SAM-dependent methyltransferase
MMSAERCAACGAPALIPYLRVAGAMGSEGLIPTTSEFGTALGDIVRCTHCGHGQLSPMPADALLAAAYATAASEDYVGEEAGQRETARRALGQIERHAPGAPQPPALLDLGCWVGFLLSEARDRGWSTLGVEPSSFGVTYARDRLGLEVIQAGLLEAELPPGPFSAAAMGDVIEHLTDPGAALDRAASVLAPGGVLWLALPDAGSRLARLMGRRWWSVIPTHVQYFTRGSLTLLLDRHGYDVLEVSTNPKAFTVGYYLGRIGGYWPLLGRGLVAAAERGGVAERVWAPDFRDRMVVVARRRAES